MKNPPLSGLRTDKNLNPCNPLRSPIESGRRPGSRRSRSHSSLGADRPSRGRGPGGRDGERRCTLGKKGKRINREVAKRPDRARLLVESTAELRVLRLARPPPPLANRPLVSSRSAFWRPAAKRTQKSAPPPPTPHPPPVAAVSGGGGRVL